MFEANSNCHAGEEIRESIFGYLGAACSCPPARD